MKPPPVSPGIEAHTGHITLRETLTEAFQVAPSASGYVTGGLHLDGDQAPVGEFKHEIHLKSVKIAEVVHAIRLFAPSALLLNLSPHELLYERAEVLPSPSDIACAAVKPVSAAEKPESLSEIFGRRTTRLRRFRPHGGKAASNRMAVAVRT